MMRGMLAWTLPLPRDLREGGQNAAKALISSGQDNVPCEG